MGVLRLGLAGVLALGLSGAALAQPIGMSQVEQTDPALPPILPLREQAKVQDAIMAERLDTVVPALMRAQKIDMWVLVAREYLEDPVVATMLERTALVTS